MKRIQSGLSPAEFLVILNQNFSELAEIREAAPYDEIGSSDDYISAINTLYGSVIVSVGSGNDFKFNLESGLINESKGIIDPSNIVLSWREDYLDISFSDNNSGQYKTEVYESINDGEYALALTLDAGISNCHYRTWQNASLKIRLRGKNLHYYSDYSEDADYTSPLVCKVTLTTLQTVHIDNIRMSTSGKKLIIDWGDEEETEVTNVISMSYDHNYASIGEYWIHFKEDVNFIGHFEFFDQLSYLAGTDVSKWILPTNLSFGHFYNNNCVGDVTSIYKSLPHNCVGFHLGANYVTCDLELVVFSENYRDCHFGSRLVGSDMEGIHGDITGWSLPDTIAHFFIEGYVHGDLTNVIPWVDAPYGTHLMVLSSSHPIGFTGDLSGWTISDTNSSLKANIGCHFTKLPRGHFRKVSAYEFINNSCNQSEIDNILTYIDNYFTGEIVPLVDCNYRLDGANMGIPSVTGLAAKTSIEGKYTAAGLSATITVNN